MEKMICVGTNLEDSKQAIEIAQKFNGVFASVEFIRKKIVTIGMSLKN